MKKFFPIIFLVLISLLLINNTTSNANDLPSANNSSNLTPSGINEQKNTSSDLYTNNGNIGLGLSWSPANSALFSGFADVRYWFNRWFGIDGGIGLINSSLGGTNNLLGAGYLNTFHITTFQIQGMIPIIERQHFVFYGDLDVLPEIGSPSFGYGILLGIGIEYAFPEYSHMSVYFQFNPASYTNGNYVAYTPIFLGFHFYF